jgi:hypothetical protein
MVRYNFIVKSKTRENFRKEYVCYSFSVYSFVARGENYPLQKSVVNNDHDRVEAIREREVGDEVSGTMSEWPHKNGSGNWKERRRGWVRVYFVLLADCTAINIVLDEGGKAWPPVVVRKEFWVL